MVDNWTGDPHNQQIGSLQSGGDIRINNDWNEQSWATIAGSVDTVATEPWVTIHSKPSNHKEQPMETLFNVIVVSKDREVLLDSKVVAESRDEAKLEVDIHFLLKETKLRTKDVTILVQEIGEVKVRKEVQKVKVVDKEEE